MGHEEQQLFSFFMYSMLVYPVTNYLVSHDRKYSKMTGVALAIGFLILVFYLSMVYFDLIRISIFE